MRPSVPKEGPLFELFSEMLKIAENHALTAEETWELAYDLSDLFNKRGHEAFEVDEEFDTDDSIYPDENDFSDSEHTLSPNTYSYLDTYYPLLDSTSILANFVTHYGGTHSDNFDFDEVYDITSDTDTE